MFYRLCAHLGAAKTVREDWLGANQPLSRHRLQHPHSARVLPPCSPPCSPTELYHKVQAMLVASDLNFALLESTCTTLQGSKEGRWGGTANSAAVTLPQSASTVVTLPPPAVHLEHLGSSPACYFCPPAAICGKPPQAEVGAMWQHKCVILRTGGMPR